MLADRLNTAVRYLEENPDSVCVVSGGQGDTEERPEADVMREYLLDKGIADSRIYREDQSTSTYENIAFSKDIIEREGLCRTVVIATQEFHQYRGQTFCAQAGFTDVSPLTCRSPEAQIASYWMREFFCHPIYVGIRLRRRVIGESPFLCFPSILDGPRRLGSRGPSFFGVEENSGKAAKIGKGGKAKTLTENNEVLYWPVDSTYTRKQDGLRREGETNG